MEKVRNITIFSLLLFVVATIMANAQDIKTIYTINSDWQFHKGELSGNEINKNTELWDNVSIPHTWNANDAFDDTPDYYRGVGIYKKKLFFSENDRNKAITIHFEGANQETEVIINGNSVGKHKGGYTFFTFPISQNLKFGQLNEVIVKVTNAFDESIPTLTADFTFFGGIYRDVYIEKTNLIHFTNTKYSAEKVMISTPKVEANNASITFKGSVTNETAAIKKIEVIQTIRNAEKLVVQGIKMICQIKANQSLGFEQKIANFKNPILWSPDNPYLYEVVSTIVDSKTKEVLDETVNPIGFRSFEFDAEKGFFINGKHCKLIGTNRHQDFQGIGNAVPDAVQIEDVKLLKEMGGNFLRIAHYPQDPVILETCDRLGIIATVEIPVVNYISESKQFAHTSIEMAKEMVFQNYNHPSLVAWAYMNEILLRPQYNKEPEKQATYFKSLTALAKDIEKTIRELDPHRYTLIPNHGNLKPYKETELTDIPLIVGWNLYAGWYSDGLKGFEGFMDVHHRPLHKPGIVSEYGAGADPRIRSVTPERFDFSLEYQVTYHTHYLKEILKRPFIAGANVWNLADFASETRHDVTPFVNNKGLITYDRKPKDSYFLYQAFLRTEPFIAIGSKLWDCGSGFSDIADGTIATQKISVFTNQKSAILYINGKSLGEKVSDENKTLIWDVPFVNGNNILEVVAKTDTAENKDFHRIKFTLIDRNLDTKSKPFESLRLCLGSKRYFMDDLTKEIWLSALEFTQNNPGWGVIGGKPFDMKNTSRQKYGTDQNIKNTDNDPIYQTAQVGIEAVKLNVPDGSYELTLHFAELISEEAKEDLAYNLGLNSVNEVRDNSRVFDVLVNMYGTEKAVSFKIKETVSNKKGFTISFRAIKGEPILNAIEVRKVF